MSIKISKVEIKKDKRRKSEKGFTYRYITISIFNFINISIGQIGIRRVDIRIHFKWGW